MNTIFKNLSILFFALSLGVSAHAGPKEFKTEEVKKFNEILKGSAIDGVKLEGLDALVAARSELKSAFNQILKDMESKPEFFKKNKDAVTKLVTSINASGRAAAEIIEKMDDGNGSIKTPAAMDAKQAESLKKKASDILKAVEALPGALAEAALGKNADLPRLQKVADVLAKLSRSNISKESTETDVLAKALTGTEAAPKTVDDIRILIEKALNENRTDGKTFTLEDLIKACLEAKRKA